MEFRVQGSGLMVQGLWCRVDGAGGVPLWLAHLRAQRRALGRPLVCVCVRECLCVRERAGARLIER